MGAAVTETEKGGRSHGFTLIEVIIAVFLFGTAMGVLIQAVSGALRQLSTTRDELVANELGQRTLAQVTERIARGEAVPSENGRYEEPDYMRYELTVEPFTVPLPEGAESDPRRAPLSTIFTPQSVRADTPEPPLRRVLLRVFREDLGPESARPLLALVALPLEKSGEKSGERDQREDGEQRDGDAPDGDSRDAPDPRQGRESQGQGGRR
jgi:prepilin-type N-terminal cleavage/methylation domain-containing protein